MSTKSAGFIRIFGGALAANLLGWAVCGLYAWIFSRLASSSSPGAQLLYLSAYPNMLLLPMAMGALAAYIWRPLKMPIGIHFLGALVITIIGIAGAYLVLKEGVICLLIISPVLLLAIFAGCLIGRVWFRKSDTLQVTIVPLLLAFLLIEEPREQTAKAW